MLPKKINLCTVRYSDNLGDGAISQCLSHIIKKVNSDIEVNEFDLAGREDYGNTNLGLKFKILKIIYSFPLFIRQLFFISMWFFILKRKIMVSWRKNVTDNTPLIFGGGQLLMDDTLNFPLKIHGLIKYAKTKKCKIAFNSVGVSEKWSWIAKYLFKKSLLNDDVVFISVRDKKSYENLILHLGNGIKDKLFLNIDPAIYANEVYQFNKTQKYIGLGLANPMALKANAMYPEHFEYNHIYDFWCDLIPQLIHKGYTLALMTNGSFEDNKFLQEIIDCFQKEIKQGTIIVYQQPSTPQDLIHTLSDMRVVIAHRLHANILSYSMGIPTVGLVWDDKMNGFAELTEQNQFFIPSGQLSVHQVVNTLESLPFERDDTTYSHLKNHIFEMTEKMLGYVFAEV